MIIRVLGGLLLVLLEFLLCKEFLYDDLILWTVLVLRSIALLIKFNLAVKKKRHPYIETLCWFLHYKNANLSANLLFSKHLKRKKKS
jgi:hypothetical protein